MAWTYDTLLEAATEYMDGQSDTFFGSVFPVCVRQAEERILQACKVQGFRRYASFTTNGINGVLTGFNDLMAPIALYYEGEPLLNKDFSWGREVYGSASGTPIAYAVRQALGNQRDTEIVLFPFPASTSSVQVEYYAKPGSLVDPPAGPGSSGTTWISQNAENALLFGVLFHLYAYEKGEDDISNRYKEEFEKALALLKGMARNDMRRDEFRASLQPQE